MYMCVKGGDIYGHVRGTGTPTHTSHHSAATCNNVRPSATHIDHLCCHCPHLVAVLQVEDAHSVVVAAHSQEPVDVVGG